MKTNNNSKSFSSVLANLLIVIFSLVGITVIINWISEKVSNWIINLISPEEAKKKAAVKAVEPLLKEAIKHADHVSLDDIEKSTTREVVDIDQVPERIREKIESDEEANASGTKTIINGKIYDKIDQFINDCKNLKRSKIGSHRVIDKDIDDIFKLNTAKDLKSKITKMEQIAPEYFNNHGFNRQTALSFTNEYFTNVNDYIRYFNVNVEKVSFEETDSIINKYFGE